MIVEHLAGSAGFRATLGVQIASGQQRRVIRPLLGDRIHRRVRRRRRRGDSTVKQQFDLTFTAVEIEISAAGRKTIKSLDTRSHRLFEFRSELEAAGGLLIARKARGDCGGQCAKGCAFDDVGFIRARRNDKPTILVTGAVILATLIPDCDQQKIRIFAARSVPFEE